MSEKSTKGAALPPIEWEPPAPEPGDRTGGVLRRTLIMIGLYLCYTVAIALFDGRAAATPEGSEALDPEAREALYLKGREVWLARECQGCHSIYGLGGHSGPDLTNTVRRNADSLLRSTMLDGRGGMPGFDLSEEELEHLLAYFAAVDATGVFPPVSLRSPVFGETP